MSYRCRAFWFRFCPRTRPLWRGIALCRVGARRLRSPRACWQRRMRFTAPYRSRRGSFKVLLLPSAWQRSRLPMRSSFSRRCAVLCAAGYAHRPSLPRPDLRTRFPPLQAKLEAAQVNSKQWGITEAQATGKQATSSKSEQDAAIKKAKELAKEKAAASKPQVGAGTVRLGTQTGVGRTLGTQPVPVSGKRLGTVRAGASPVKAKEPTPTAGGAAAAEDSSDPIVALVKKAGTKCWISESSGRSITNAEVTDSIKRCEQECAGYSAKSGH